VPPGYDPHVVAASLVAFLAAMKEPLLTFERYEIGMRGVFEGGASHSFPSSFLQLCSLVMITLYEHF
jgi:hypothetical protein